MIHWGGGCLGLTFEYIDTLILSIKPTSIPYFIITSLSEAVWACFQFCFILSLVNADLYVCMNMCNYTD